MASLTGPVYVPAPNPVIPRYGIFKVATGPLDLPINARQGGVQYEISVCDLPECYEIECQAQHNSKTLTNGPTIQVADPFVIYSVIFCSPVGLANWGEQKVRGWLFDQLRAGEQSVLERTFSTSDCGLSPGLANNDNVVPLAPADTIVEAVSNMESWLYARYGLPGVIHAPAAAAPYFTASHVIEKDSAGIWRTDMDTMVSFGDYAGVGPSGQAAPAGSTFLYITGQVAIWRTPDSELFIPPLGQIIDRSTNEITMVMEREYVISYDCYVASVQVTLDVGLT